jgi:uncharacterized protein YkwD
MTHKTALFSLLCAVLLSACGGGGGGDTSATSASPALGRNGAVDVNTVSQPGGQTCDIGQYAQKILAAINAARAAGHDCGGTAMPPANALSWNMLLTQAAAGHSADMATHNFFSHTGFNGSHSSDRIVAAGYVSNGSGEILAKVVGANAGNMIPLILDGWLKSPGHCRVLMSGDMKEMGAACTKSGKSAYTTVNFGG